MLGRGIAEAVLTSLGIKRLDRKNHNPAPLVIVLAGNNRTGAYSLCAGRWLSLRGIRVLGVLCASEEEELEVPLPPKSVLTTAHPHPAQTLQKLRGQKSRPGRPPTNNRSITLPARNNPRRIIRVPPFARRFLGRRRQTYLCGPNKVGK